MRVHYLFEGGKKGQLSAQEDKTFPQVNSASSRFAGTYPGEMLAGAQHTVSYSFVNKELGPRTDINFQPGDVVVCIKNYFREMVDTAKYAQNNGAIVVMQQNDPHILSTEESLAEVRSSHGQLLSLSDGVIACSNKLAELCAEYNPTVTVIYDGVDTKLAAPAFNNAATSLKLMTTCYPHNHADIAASLPSIDSFAADFGPVEYTVVTAVPRADQLHHGSDFGKISSYAPSSENLKISFVEYSVPNAVKAIEESDIVVIQSDSGHRTGYKAEWYPNKSNGRGAAAIHAGKPFVCPNDILSYQIFCNQNGGYNTDNNVGKTLSTIMNLAAEKLNSDIASGQAIVIANNSHRALAQHQFDFFAKLREAKGFKDHGMRP